MPTDDDPSPAEINDYQAQVEQAFRAFRPRIRRLLVVIRQALVPNWQCSAVEDTTCDTFEMRFTATPKGGKNEDGFDVALQVCESLQFEGTVEGINFELSGVEEGGAILFMFTPFNFTPEVWVRADNRQALSERLGLVERIDIEGIAELAQERVVAAG